MKLRIERGGDVHVCKLQFFCCWCSHGLLCSGVHLSITVGSEVWDNVLVVHHRITVADFHSFDIITMSTYPPHAQDFVVVPVIITAVLLVCSANALDECCYIVIVICFHRHCVTWVYMIMSDCSHVWSHNIQAPISHCRLVCKVPNAVLPHTLYLCYHLSLALTSTSLL